MPMGFQDKGFHSLLWFMLGIQHLLTGTYEGAVMQDIYPPKKPIIASIDNTQAWNFDAHDIQVTLSDGIIKNWNFFHYD